MVPPYEKDSQGNHSGWQTMRRMSQGSRLKAIEMVQNMGRKLFKSFENFVVDEFDFDCYLAEQVNEGCEVEWVEE